MIAERRRRYLLFSSGYRGPFHPGLWYTGMGPIDLLRSLNAAQIQALARVQVQVMHPVLVMLS